LGELKMDKIKLIPVVPVSPVQELGKAQLDPRPGILRGWWPVLLHPILLHRWILPMVRSGACWLVGHKLRDVLHQQAGMVSVECSRCQMRVLARPAASGLQDLQHAVEHLSEDREAEIEEV